MPKHLFDRTMLGLLLPSAALLATTAVAGPRGGTVAFGAISISQPVPGFTAIRQSTAQGIINWQDFSVGQGQAVFFQQPSVSSVTLNRVVAANPSLINGTVVATGSLFLINPYGVIFGPSSQVNVTSLVASTLSISDSDFLNRNYQLVQSSNNLLSAVVNQGYIAANNGGAVALIAPIVNNQGQIVAAAGRIVLGATTQASISLDGAGYVNVTGPNITSTVARVPSQFVSPQLQQAVYSSSSTAAHAVIPLPDGTVVISGGNGVAVNSGQLQAGNSITVDGSTDVALAPGSTISASTVQLSAPGRVGYLAPPSGSGPAAVVAAGTANLNGGTIQSGSGGGLVVAGNSVNLTGTNGIGQSGTPVTVITNQLSATSTNGAVSVSALGDVTVNSVTGSGSSPVNLSSSGSILAGNTAPHVQGGDVTLSAVGTAGSPSAHLVVQANSVNVNSSSGSQYVNFVSTRPPPPPTTEADSSSTGIVFAKFPGTFLTGTTFSAPPPPGLGGGGSSPTATTGGTLGSSGSGAGTSGGTGSTVTVATGPVASTGSDSAGSGGSIGVGTGGTIGVGTGAPIAAAPTGANGSNDSTVTTISNSSEGTLGRTDNVLQPLVRDDTTKLAGYGDEGNRNGLVQIVQDDDSRHRRGRTTGRRTATKLVTAPNSRP